MINSHNEWDKLREIIVGTSLGTMPTLTWNKPGPVPLDVMQKAYSLAKKAAPQWFYEEVEEDLEDLSSTLRKFGVKVHRPEPFDFSTMYSTPHWSTTSNNVYNTRDLNLVVGNHLIESPSYLRSRYFESSGLYDIWYDNYFDEGLITPISHK